MTANTNAPFGFRQSTRIAGAAPNYGVTPGKMAYNASATYCGDPLVLSSGKLAVASTTGGTGAAVVGVAVAFSWVSTAQNKRVWQRFYPGSDSQGNADVDVLFINDPNALFEVQSNGTAIAQGDIGKGVNFATGTGNQYSGQSGFSLDYATLNATLGVLPFVVQGFIPAPGLAFGYDPTGDYNIAVVGFNNPTKF